MQKKLQGPNRQEGSLMTSSKHFYLQLDSLTRITITRYVGIPISMDIHYLVVCLIGRHRFVSNRPVLLEYNPDANFVAGMKYSRGF
ncbi:hypothetical protein OUZ56_001594 [Daphnia magna]|uniref:Uncharacterized protein n=1 Tax=Daphnia magna TaxID=35525 RepID=A0ABR0A354_9CRUS|nr:hypothetical protein OUZ56_001594 [Daphnia magna]